MKQSDRTTYRTQDAMSHVVIDKNYTSNPQMISFQFLFV